MKAHHFHHRLRSYPILWQTFFVLIVAVWTWAAVGGGTINATSQYAGTVVDEQGRPVAGATVDWYSYRASPRWLGNMLCEPDLERRTSTDRKGAFAIPALPGATVVVVQKAGLAPAWKIWSDYLPGSSAPLVLTAPTTLSGMVVDTNGQPVTDAEVWAADVVAGDMDVWLTQLNDLAGKPARAYFFARTSANGHFRIKDFPKHGHATLAADKPGLAQYPIGDTFAQREIVSGQKNIELMLGPAGAIEGKVVVQEAGQPVANVEVWLLPSTGAATVHGPVKSGADGWFQISDLQPATYNVWPVFPGKPVPNLAEADYGMATVTAGKTNCDVLIRATAGVLVEVSVVSTNDLKPCANVAVSSGRLTAYTGNDGKAVLRLTPGKAWFFVSKSDWSLRRTTAEIQPGQTNRVLIQMIPPPHIAGIVRGPDGAPAADVQVSFHPGHYPGAPWYAETNTDQNGRYDLIIRQDSAGFEAWDGPINPTNFLLARDFKRNLAAIAEFGPSPLDFKSLGVIPPQLDLNLQAGISFSGSVRDSGGEPIANAAVDFRILAGQSTSLVEEKPLKTDAEGLLSVSALPQGRRYMISQITAEGYGSAFKGLNAQDTQTNHYVFPPLVVKKADRILSGYILDPDGHPIPGATVRFDGIGQRQWPTTTTDRHGYFLFDAVCEGEVHLYANAFVGGAPGQNTAMTSEGAMGTTAQGGDTNLLINLFPQFDANGEKLQRERLLHDAVRDGDLDQVKSLLDGQANVDAKDVMGLTPLHEAAVGGNAEIAILLLVHGADVNVRANNGFTPLHWAAMYDHTNVAAVLLAHGAYVNAMNNNGQTPLRWAVANRSMDVADLLREHGGVEHSYEASHPDHTMTNWDTAELRDAARSGNVKVAQELLQSNPSLISGRDEQDRTLLILAAMGGHTNVADVLLGRKADLNASDIFGRTALHWAAVLDRTEMAQLLLASGADVNARATDGDSPLHEAARSGRMAMAELLLANQADINATNIAGWTPLHVALAAATRGVPKNLAGSAADGFTKMLQANKDVANFLRQHGAHE